MGFGVRVWEFSVWAVRASRFWIRAYQRHSSFFVAVVKVCVHGCVCRVHSPKGHLALDLAPLFAISI